ncbi:MAG: protein-L-isoaspartate O-methyltransferase [Pseudomonadota bacterium]
MLPSADAREQMTYQQVRAWSALPPKELAVFDRLSREQFVPAAWQRLAYADMAVPLAHGQHMLRPSVVGRIVQAVGIQQGDLALEIGTGSGYVSACLSLLGAKVLSLEVHADLAEQARHNLRVAGLGDVQVEHADAFALPASGPRYDVIALTGSMPVYDPRFEALLRPGGRLFVLVGREPIMEARLVTLDAQGQRAVHSLFETSADRLLHAPDPAVFSF